MANEDLGKTLRRLRRLAALTQEELAERSGVSADVIRQNSSGSTRHASPRFTLSPTAWVWS